MKELESALANLRKRRSELQKEKSALDAKVYKLDKAIKSLEEVNDLQRVKRVFHEIICKVCNKPFKAARKTQVICSHECRNKFNADRAIKMRKPKPVTLIQGDQLKAGQ